MLCLDWEKAFDRVDRTELINSLNRMGVAEKLINIVKMLYKDTRFMIEIEGTQSKLGKQKTGIRQGCPLSPYLFFHQDHQ